MAEKKDDAPTLDVRDQALAQMISQGISQGIVDAGNKFGPIKQIPITAYHPKTPFNPKGLPEKLRPQFSRVYKQNGFGIDQDKCTDELRLLLEQVQAGSYCGGLIDVTVRYPEGGGNNIVDICYNNGSLEQRFDLKGRFQNLAHMLREILAEQQLKTA